MGVHFIKYNKDKLFLLNKMHPRYGTLGKLKSEVFFIFLNDYIVQYSLVELFFPWNPNITELPYYSGLKLGFVWA